MVSLSIRDLSSRRYTTNNRWCSKKTVPAQLLNARWLKLACLADTDSGKKRTANCSKFSNSTVFSVACAKRSYALDYAGALPLVDKKTPFASIAPGRLSVDGNRRPNSHWVVA